MSARRWCRALRTRYSAEVGAISGRGPAKRESAFHSLIDYIAISGSMERNVIEYANHLHEHFVYPCSINEQGRYVVPENEKEGYR